MREVFRKGREHSWAGLDEHDSGLARVDGAKVTDQHRASDVGERACELDACRPGADDDESHERSARLFIRLVLRMLERKQHAPANLERILEGLQRRRITLPVLVAEVRIAHTRGEDQIVVPQRLAFLDANDSRFQVDGGDLAEQHPGVCLPAEYRADRVGDVSRR